MLVDDREVEILVVGCVGEQQVEVFRKSFAWWGLLRYPTSLRDLKFDLAVMAVEVIDLVKRPPFAKGMTA